MPGTQQNKHFLLKNGEDNSFQVSTVFEYEQMPHNLIESSKICSAKTHHIIKVYCFLEIMFVFSQKQNISDNLI